MTRPWASFRGFVPSQGSTRHNWAMEPEKRRMPPWLVGLILAVALFVIVLVVANVLGFGDDPVVGALR
jgi:hypothetical protein